MGMPKTSPRLLSKMVARVVLITALVRARNAHFPSGVALNGQILERLSIREGAMGCQIGAGRNTGRRCRRRRLGRRSARPAF